MKNIYTYSSKYVLLLILIFFGSNIINAQCSTTVVVTQNPTDLTIIYNPAGNTVEIDAWLNNNGGAIASSSCGSLSWTYEVNEEYDLFDGDLILFVTFTAEDGSGNSATLFPDIIYQNFPTAGDGDGTGDTLCEVTSFDLADIANVDLLSSTYDNSSITISGETGTFDPQVSGLTVDFPDKGAGSFNYDYTATVSTPISIGTIDLVIEDSASWFINNVTIPFNPGPDKEVLVCPGQTLTLTDLYNALEIIDGTDDPSFNPDSYWLPSTYQGTGNYIFNAQPFLPDCGGIPATVTVVEESIATFTIPDLQFEQALIDLEIDNDGIINGEIEACGVSNISELELISYNISNFDGLQYFTGLTSFTLINDQASVGSMDFSNNLALMDINIINCPFIGSVDVTQNLALTGLTVVTRGNLLNAIDISNNVNLTSLQLADNQITELDISNNLKIEQLSIAINPITEIDLSNLSELRTLDTYESQLQFLDLSNNTLLESLNSDIGNLITVNINNGNNNILTNVELNGNPDLGCILVDNVSFAESQTEWLKDATASYVTSSDVLSVDNFPQTLSIIYNLDGNEAEIDAWLANNGGAAVSSCGDVVWSYELDYYETDFFEYGDSLICNMIFTATGKFGNQETFPAILEFQSFPVAGETNQGDGVICGKSYNLNGINGIDFESSKYDNSTVILSGDGTINGFDVDFPDKGAGSFFYSYSFSVTTNLMIGSLDFDVLDGANWSLPNVTIPFDPGENKVLDVCVGADLTLEDLYNILEIVDGTDAPEFDPNDYWFDTTGAPIAIYSGPGEYVFNAQGFLPQCGGIPTTVTVTETVNCDLSIKAFLQGPATNPNTGEESLMRDDLRVLDLIPITTPYPDALSCSASVFNLSGPDAIVDWVWIELRDNNDNTNILNSRSALLQRDGDIVDLDGVSPLIVDVPDGSYYIVINHRNHLGIMSVNPIALTFAASPISVDFTDGSIATYGSNAQVVLPNGSSALWAGDTNNSNQIRFSGSNNTVNPIRDYILSDPGNIFNLTTFQSSGYLDIDVDLNGFGRFSGTNADSNVIRNVVLSHPVNIFNLTTFKINGTITIN